MYAICVVLLDGGRRINPIHIHTQLDSTTLHLPELEPLVGKRVEIIILEDATPGIATEKHWESFFENAGTGGLIDPELVQRYREFDRISHVFPIL